MIWLLGSTGLTGSHTAQFLDSEPDWGSQTYCPVRKAKGTYQNLKEIEIDFKTEPISQLLPNPTSVICCLGTTIKKAGSKEAFRNVDYEIPLRFAEEAKKRGAKQFILISSIGANVNSSTFYLRIKGELEEMLNALSFESTIILRPAILMGNRAEFRLGENIGIQLNKLISPFLIGSLKNYRPINSKDVAKVIWHKTKHPDKGFHIFESFKIQNLADSLP